MCYETTSGEKDCQALAISEDSTSSESILSPDSDVRLTSAQRVDGACYITTDDEMICTVAGPFDQASVNQNQFPTAPQNLSVNFFSDSQAELTWERPTEDILASDFATGYEILRDGVFIDRLPVVTSYFDGNTHPDADLSLIHI